MKTNPTSDPMLNRLARAIESGTECVDVQQLLEDAHSELSFCRERLRLICGIAEGSTTANSLPHIARLARQVKP